MSVKIGDTEVTAINIGTSPVRIVNFNGTAIWNNFDESNFITKKTGKGDTNVGTWTWLANNVNAFMLNTNTSDSGWNEINVTVWVRIYFSSTLYYDFRHHCTDGGLFGNVHTDTQVDKNGAKIWDGGTLVANLTTSAHLINPNTDWRFDNDDAFKMYWQIYDMNGITAEQLNNINYFKNGYPKVYYACTGNQQGSNVSYTIKTISFK